MIQGKTFTVAGGIPKIPELANGGYFKANTPTLAWIGEGRQNEIVAPESKIYDQVAKALKDVMGNTNNNDRPIELTVKIGDETIARSAIKGINSITRRNGGVNPIIF